MTNWKHIYKTYLVNNHYYKTALTAKASHLSGSSYCSGPLEYFWDIVDELQNKYQEDRDIIIKHMSVSC